MRNKIEEGLPDYNAMQAENMTGMVRRERSPYLAPSPGEITRGIGTEAGTWDKTQGTVIKRGEACVVAPAKTIARPGAEVRSLGGRASFVR